MRIVPDSSPTKFISSTETEYTHPLQELLFPDANLSPDEVVALRYMDDNAITALELFYDAIVDGIKLCHKASVWTDGTADQVMAWVFHQYPEISTAALASGLDGVVFQGSIEAYRSERTRLESENQERRRELGVLALRKMPYQDYLKTTHWQDVRESALEMADFRCQLCNAQSLLHVHHRTYERRGAEEPGDVTALCADCHQHFHDKLKVR